MRLLAVLTLLAGLRAPSAGQILTRAEDVRNPSLSYAVDFTIHGVPRTPTGQERDASYSMLASGKDKTVILMRTPADLFGASVLMADEHYWLLLPRASNPWELSAAQMMAGDIATGDLARSNLTRGYAATLAGEELCEGAPCWKLELQAEGETSHYARIVYWVAKKGFLPAKLEHYARSGKLAKVVRYGDYRKGALGLRSMTIHVESLDEWKEDSTLVFTNLRKIDPAPLTFTSEGMARFRDAVLGARRDPGGAEPGLESILRAMRR